MNLPASQLYEIIRRSKIPSQPFFPDRLYWLPTLKWIEEKLRPLYSDTLKRLRVSKYSVLNDCDNFESGFFWLAQVAYNFYASNTWKAEAVAIGSLWYLTSKTSGHAINFAILDSQELIFLEPQKALSSAPLKVKLTPAEISTVSYVRI